MSEDNDNQETAVPKQQIVHTPGPWVADYEGSIWHIKSVAPRPDYFTPTVARYDTRAVSISQLEKQANARLIAKSPELIDFVESFVHEWEATWVDPDDVNHEWSELYRRAKELIRDVNGGHSVLKGGAGDG